MFDDKLREYLQQLKYDLNLVKITAWLDPAALSYQLYLYSKNQFEYIIIFIRVDDYKTYSDFLIAVKKALEDKNNKPEQGWEA